MSSSWVRVVAGDPSSKWHAKAYERSGPLPDGTYELCGPHFQTNPEGFVQDSFVRHGAEVLEAPRTFDGLRAFLTTNAIEGVVFLHPDGRMCKIRRNDFGLEWGCKPTRTR